MNIETIAVDTFPPPWANVVYPVSLLVALASVVLLVVFLRSRRRGLPRPRALRAQALLLAFGLAATTASVAYHYVVWEPAVRAHEKGCLELSCPVRLAADGEVMKKLGSGAGASTLAVVSLVVGRRSGTAFVTAKMRA